MEALDLIKLIEDRCRRLNLTESQLSQAVVGHGTLVSDIRRGRSPSAKRLENICDALGLEFYVGPPREGPRWGPLAIAGDLPQRIQERLDKLAAEYEDWPGAHREDFMERFIDAMARLLGPWPYEDEPASRQPPPLSEAAREVLKQLSGGASTGEPTGASAWAAATEAQREQAAKRLAAVERSNALAREAKPRLDADAIAAKEAGVSAATVGSWRRKVQGLQPDTRKQALLDRHSPGAPSAIIGPIKETLEALASHHGPYLTAKYARQVLIEEHGKAPGERTLRRWLKHWRDELRERPAMPSHELPPDVAALPGREPDAAAHADADRERLSRAIGATETILEAAGLALGPDEKARLVLAIREQLYEERGDASARDTTGPAHRIA